MAGLAGTEMALDTDKESVFFAEIDGQREAGCCKTNKARNQLATEGTDRVWADAGGQKGREGRRGVKRADGSKQAPG